ncbi:MAG TPA: hypothetical protein VNI77_06190 [Nitrososphaera sp.]|nr:hypothetical protein [Nitrososphaera sp.]
MRALPILFVVSCLAASAVGQASACEVLSLPTVQEAADSSSIIFSGKVAEFKTILMSDSMQDMRAALFEVDEYWKSDAEHYRQLVVFTAIDHRACGYDFEEGKSYLVYAHTRDDGLLRTSIGTRTMPIENAQDDLAFLEQGTAPAQQGSWEEQLEAIPLQPEVKPSNTVIETNNAILLVGSGTAIAGLAAFFSLRRLKDGNRARN